MAATAFDTLALARALRNDAKFAPEQAEAMAAALSSALSAEIATKQDLREIEIRLSARMDALSARMDGMETTIKHDILRWVIPLILGNWAISLGVLLKLL